MGIPDDFVLRRPEVFFTTPTDLHVDFEEIRRTDQAEAQKNAHREAEAWSELGEQTIGQEIPQSSFARKLAEDPVLAARCEKIVQALRAAAAEDIAAGERSQRLTGADFSIIINARTPGH